MPLLQQKVWHCQFSRASLLQQHQASQQQQLRPLAGMVVLSLVRPCFQKSYLGYAVK